jgi:hypothetical protein
MLIIIFYLEMKARYTVTQKNLKYVENIRDNKNDGM